MNAVTRLIVDRVVKNGKTGNNILSLVNSVLNTAKRNDWLVNLAPDQALKEIKKAMSNWNDKKLVTVLSGLLAQTIMKKMSIREWEQMADEIDKEIEMNGRVAAIELVEVAKILTAALKQAEMPYGKDAGKVKRAINNVLKKAGYGNIFISRNRNGSGFTGYGDLRPDSEEPYDWKEREKDLKKALKKYESKLKSTNPKPKTVWTDVRGSRDGFKAVIGMLYSEGHQVTPLEML